MTNPRREAVSQQLQDESTLSTDVSACARLFCVTLAQLNAISEQQIKALLEVAITTAEVVRSLASSEPEAKLKNAALAKGEEIAELGAKLTGAADKMSQSRSDSEGVEAGTEESQQIGGQQKTFAAINAEAFCAQVEANINVAMQNSLACQQQMNVLGQAILAQAAALLFSVVGTDPSNKSGQNA